MENLKFIELSNDEIMEVDGGMAPAALYALGFVCGCSPLAACVGIGCVVVGTGVYVYGRVKNHKK